MRTLICPTMLLMSCRRHAYPAALMMSATLAQTTLAQIQTDVGALPQQIEWGQPPGRSLWLR